MATIRVNQHGYLFFDFWWNGKRYRESTGYKDTPANRRKLKEIAKIIQARIKLGTFDYKSFFPHSRKVTETLPQKTFREFTLQWLEEIKPPYGLKPSSYYDYKNVVEKHLIPAFGDKALGEIDETDIITLRNSLELSPSRVNFIIGRKA